VTPPTSLLASLDAPATQVRYAALRTLLDPPQRPAAR
jgi:hypothetical protein